ncbi:MAG: ADP-heptose--LPS heptosyltransferase 2 [Elusimicrobia bacterium]|nr:ADP-heptose--LPS heptosyltransferase 2 [Elusimicrobiota bacterium]
MALGNYAFKKKKWILLAWLIDVVGYLFKQPDSQRFLSPQRVLAVRCDQLGDMVQTLPFIDGLLGSFPGVRIDFLTSRLGAEFLKIARPEVHPLVVDSPSRSSLKSQLKNENYDIAFDLRGDIRLIFYLRSIVPRNLVGYGATGGGFLLDIEPSWDRNLPAIEKNIALLKAVGGQASDLTPKIEFKSKGEQTARKILTVVIHPDAGTPAKKWPLSYFANVIDSLAEGFSCRFILVGLDRSIGEEIVRLTKTTVENEMGKTNLQGLLEFLSQSDIVISNDSGPAHLAAALGKPVWVIWSGTAESKIWAPRGDTVTVLQHRVECSPCSLRNCPLSGHPCLEDLSPKEVTESLLSYFPRFPGKQKPV